MASSYPVFYPVIMPTNCGGEIPMWLGITIIAVIVIICIILLIWIFKED